jgi:hypothetical protein
MGIKINDEDNYKYRLGFNLVQPLFIKRFYTNYIPEFQLLIIDLMEFNTV